MIFCLDLTINSCFSGKPPNEFAFDGRPKERDFALKVVGDVHEQWKALMRREESGSVVRDAIQCCREIRVNEVKFHNSDDVCTGWSIW